MGYLGYKKEKQFFLMLGDHPQFGGSLLPDLKDRSGASQIVLREER